MVMLRKYFPGAAAIAEILFQNVFLYESIKYAFLFLSNL